MGLFDSEVETISTLTTPQKRVSNELEREILTGFGSTKLGSRAEADAKARARARWKLMPKADRAGKKLADLIEEEMQATFAQRRPAGAAPFPGQLSAPIEPDVQAARENLLGFTPTAGAGVPDLSPAPTLSDFARETPAGVPDVPGLSAALTRNLSGTPSTTVQLDRGTTERFFKESVAAPLLREFDLEIGPRIAAAASGIGAGFSSRRGAETRRALESLQTELTSRLATEQLTNMRLEEQARLGLAESAAARSLESIPQALQLQQQLAGIPIAQSQEARAGQAADRGFEATRANIALTGRGQEADFNLARGQLGLQGLGQQFNQLLAQSQASLPFQGLAQSELDRAREEFLRTAPENNPFTRLAMSFIGSNQTAVSAPSSDPFASLLGGLGGLGGLLGAL